MIKETLHQFIAGTAQDMSVIESCSVDLVVTSPPYPMIEMWDEIFSLQNPKIKYALQENNGFLAFELMHLELDQVWKEVARVIAPGGFVCINIGDATRTINENFSLYPNHSRIIQSFQKLGFTNLPSILWRKQTNAPNKFMGSGMLPSGAYVTLEHEWILIFRKGYKRKFIKNLEKEKRRASSFFWEERNTWFSDIWELKGVKQKMDQPRTRQRTAAYPFEIPYRLINMYSLQDDVILDPFLGTGTTSLAAISSKRNSIGFEIDTVLLESAINRSLLTPISQLNSRVESRITGHQEFIQKRELDQSKYAMKHYNEAISMPVMTSQETQIQLFLVDGVERKNNEIIASHRPLNMFQHY